MKMPSCALFTVKELEYILNAVQKHDPDIYVGNAIRRKIKEETSQRKETLMQKVKRYWAAAATDIEEAPCLVEGWVPVHLSSDYDALAAELAAMTTDRDYHRLAAIEQSVHWRNIHEERIRALEAELGQWRARGSIVGVIIRDEEGKDWRWDGSQWCAFGSTEETSAQREVGENG
jgi:hypothetical protein